MLSLRKKLKRIKTRIKSYIKLKQDQRFLKKYHCDTWAQYHYRFDPDVNYRTLDIEQFYHGYNHFHCIDDNNHYAYDLLADYGPGGAIYGYMKIKEWCTKNCQGKFRIDIHRVLPGNGFGSRYAINEIGGLDYLFFAFKNERDYLMFQLRWG